MVARLEEPQASKGAQENQSGTDWLSEHRPGMRATITVYITRPVMPYPAVPHLTVQYRRYVVPEVQTCRTDCTPAVQTEWARTEAVEWGLSPGTEL